MKAWKTLSSELVLQYRKSRLYKHKVELPNGSQLDDYFVLESGSAAILVPLLDRDNVIMIRQYRYAVNREYLEFPAGGIELEEDPQHAAARELTEETGYAASKITYLATTAYNASKSKDKLHIYLAQGLELVSAQNLDITEEIEVVVVPIKEIPMYIQKGEIGTNSTLSAIAVASQYLFT